MSSLAPKCPRCSATMELIPGKSGLFWGCPNFPLNRCTGRVMSDATGQPLAPAGRTRWRKAAHAVFDMLWWPAGTPSRQRTARVEAYEWLRQELGLEKEEAHFGLFDDATCVKVIRLVADRLILPEEEER